MTGLPAVHPRTTSYVPGSWSFVYASQPLNGSDLQLCRAPMIFVVLYDFETPSNNIDVMREGLRALQAQRSQGGADAGPPSDASSDSAPPSSSPPPADDDAGLSDDGVLDADTRTLVHDA
jgi:hypothetical protein